MQPLITNPGKFADQFNRMVPGVSLKLTVEDVKKLKELGLICRYSYYSMDDTRMVMGILKWGKYLESQHHQPDQPEIPGKIPTPPTCKGCGEPLPRPGPQPGRHREYCATCEPDRVKWRNCKSRERKGLIQKTLQKLV